MIQNGVWTEKIGLRMMIGVFASINKNNFRPALKATKDSAIGSVVERLEISE